MSLKNKFLKFGLLSILLTSCSFNFGNNNNEDEPKSVELKSLTYFDARRTKYTTDDAFDDYINNGGLKVIAEYSDYTERQLEKTEFSWVLTNQSNNIINSSLPFDEKGTYNIAISYKENKLNYSIDVLESSTVKLSSISASNYTSEIKTNSSYNFDGVVTASYTDGSSKIVTSYCDYSAIDASSEGEKELSISYKEGRITKTTQILIFVSDSADVQRPNQIKLVSPSKGQNFDAYDKRYDEYLNAKTEEEIVSALETYSLCSPQGKTVKLEWNSNGSSSYRLFVSMNEEFNDSKVYELNENETSYVLSNLIPGSKYYWKVEGTKTDDYSKINYFTTSEGTVRFISAGNVQNIRDFGGWKAEQNKEIKYGRLFRGNGLNGYAGLPTLNSDGKKVFNDELGIKTEIDLRTAGSDDNNQNQNYFDQSKPYIKATISQYTYVLDSESFNSLREEKGTEFVGNGSASTASASSLKTIFETLADVNSYPIYVHCNVGADRTGTLSLLLCGLLGTTYDDLMKNYELTSFYSSSGKRYRSSIKDGVFDKDTIFKSSKDGNFIAMQIYYDALMKYHSNGGTFQDACTNFLKSYAGISDLVINKVKENLLN